MDLPDSSSLNDVADWLWTDRSDWFQYLQYFGLAKGIWNLSDGLYSTLKSSRREPGIPLSMQNLEGTLQIASGTMLVITGLYGKPLSIYTAFAINAFCEMLTAFIKYLMLSNIDLPKYASQLDQKIRLVPNKAREKLNEDFQKAKIRLIEKTVLSACWLTVEVLHPAALLYIAMGITYLCSSRPVLTQFAGSLFSLCKRLNHLKDKAASDEDYIEGDDENVVRGLSVPDRDPGSDSEFPDGISDDPDEGSEYSSEAAGQSRFCCRIC